ncbi:hypothetical protein D3C73_1090020 [compost metagenome]
MANGPIDTFSLVVRSDWASKVGRWQVATEYRVVDTFGVGVKKGPLREMLEQTTGVREIYLQNFALVVGEVAPEDRGIDRVVGVSDRDHGKQPPAEFVLDSLARATVLGLCPTSQIPKTNFGSIYGDSSTWG